MFIEMEKKLSPVVCLEDIRFSYGSSLIIDHLSMDIYGGDFVAVKGPSGIGKSTLLNLIAGLLDPVSGVILRDTDRIGYVFQQPNLLPWKTAEENIIIPLISLEYEVGEAKQIAHEYLNKMELWEFRKSYPSELSGGMAQRIALARAFAVNPEILLLDEPYSALDSGNKILIRKLIENMLHEYKSTVLYVTHYPEDIEGLANRSLTFISNSNIVVA